MVKNYKKPKSYLDARSWLLVYAEMHADKPPNSNQLWLPAGIKYFYHAAYVRDRVSRGCQDVAGITVWNKMWRAELPFIIIRPQHGPFKHCESCDYLKLLMHEAQDR